MRNIDSPLQSAAAKMSANVTPAATAAVVAAPRAECALKWFGVDAGLLQGPSSANGSQCLWSLGYRARTVVRRRRSVLLIRGAQRVSRFDVLLQTLHRAKGEVLRQRWRHSGCYGGCGGCTTRRVCLEVVGVDAGLLQGHLQPTAHSVCGRWGTGPNGGEEEALHLLIRGAQRVSRFDVLLQTLHRPKGDVLRQNWYKENSGCSASLCLGRIIALDTCTIR